MREDQLGDAVVDLFPHLVRHHRFERRGRQLEGEVDAAAMAEIDDLRPLALGGEQEVGDRLDRPLRGREPDAQRRCTG